MEDTSHSVTGSADRRIEILTRYDCFYHSTKRQRVQTIFSNCRSFEGSKTGKIRQSHSAMPDFQEKERKRKTEKRMFSRRCRSALSGGFDDMRIPQNTVKVVNNL